MVKKIILVLLFVGVVVACSSDDGDNGGGPTDPVDNFDRGAMLTNLADNVIIPAFNDFGTKMTALKTAGTTFTAMPDQANLDALRTAWYEAYKTYQKVEMFNIGKAEELGYNYFMNIYPLTVEDVENNIANGGYDLDHPNNHDAQGFPSLDYLLYGVGADDTAILAKYTSDANADGYKMYVSDVLNQMESKTSQVVSDWNGSYRDSFVASTGNTATSSVNKFVNDFIYYYEKGLRANKFGIPAGVFSPTTLPEKVEAYYRDDISKELSLIALQAVQDVFVGRYYGINATGESFHTYLVYLQRSDISNAITSQFSDAESEVNPLMDSFYDQVMNDNAKMTMAYDELQKAVVLLKVDMLQAFNINVDYIDADGD